MVFAFEKCISIDEIKTYKQGEKMQHFLYASLWNGFLIYDENYKTSNSSICKVNKR